MTERKVHVLRLPRLASGAFGRSRETETVATWDDVPVLIRQVDPRDVPVAFRSVRPRAPESARSYRVFDGVPFAELPSPHGSPRADWAALVAEVMPGLLFQSSLGPWAQPNGPQEIYGWRQMLEGASRKRGVMPPEAVTLRLVVDDGKAAQATMAARLADRLLAVGDRLLVRSEVPWIHVTATGGNVMRHDAAEWLDWRHPGEFTGRRSAFAFRVDRDGAAMDFATALSDRLGFRPLADGGHRIVVEDASAVRDCYDRIGPEGVLDVEGMVQTAEDMLRPILGHMPDGEIERFADLRRMMREGDLDGARAWMDGLSATRDAVFALADKPGNFISGHEPHARLDALALRHELSDPRLAEDNALDALVLAGLR